MDFESNAYNKLFLALYNIYKDNKPSTLAQKLAYLTASSTVPIYACKYLTLDISFNDERRGVF